MNLLGWLTHGQSKFVKSCRFNPPVMGEVHLQIYHKYPAGCPLDPLGGWPKDPYFGSYRHLVALGSIAVFLAKVFCGNLDGYLLLEGNISFVLDLG